MWTFQEKGTAKATVPKLWPGQRTARSQVRLGAEGIKISKRRAQESNKDHILQGPGAMVSTLVFTRRDGSHCRGLTGC